VLDPTRYHLGTEGFPQWQGFVGQKPQAEKNLRGVEYQRALRDATRAVQHGWVNYAGTVP
jgi:hypothetical protein